ncbi:MAG: hypothetical protein ACI9KE_003872 [Polyangiales bacterium]|jgi:hypothetical protein
MAAKEPVSPRGWRVAAVLFSVALLGVVFVPVTWEAHEDSFPLSSYPMFSHGRPSPELTLMHAIGIRADGSREPLSPMLSAGNREVLQSLRTIELGVHHGADSFCAEIAGRLREAGEDYAEVEIATDTWDAVAYFANDDPQESLQQHDVHVRCEVAP